MYQTLSYQTSDLLRSSEARFKKNEPWYFINALPSTLVIYIKKYGSNDSRFLVSMGPRQTIKFESDTFDEKDKLYTYYRMDNGKLIPFLESYTIFLNSKTIKFGAVTYDFKKSYNAGFFDIEGVWLCNKLPIPIDVYYNGNMVVQLFPHSDLSYLGGGSSETYFDNSGYGLNYLDKLEFSYSLPPPENKKLFSITIDDVKCNKIFIGTVSSETGAPYPDNAVYRIQEPNYSALTYFDYIGNGTSIMTNPKSPFYS